MTSAINPVDIILGVVLLFASLGVILLSKPVHASLSFLLTLLILAALYLQLAAQFIAVMQILVYAGAILVIFMFVIVLFQDAHQQISQFDAKSPPLVLFLAAFAFTFTLVLFGTYLSHLTPAPMAVSKQFGTVQGLGEALYLDFFFPFEAVILLFLIAVVGALYVAKKVR